MLTYETASTPEEVQAVIDAEMVELDAKYPTPESARRLARTMRPDPEWLASADGQAKIAAGRAAEVKRDLALQRIGVLSTDWDAVNRAWKNS